MKELAATLVLSPFDFTAGSVQRLSTVLYSLITSATLRVYPNAELEREVLGLRVAQKAGGWRVDHATGGYSDRVMALALAALDVPGGPPEPSVQYSMIDGLALPINEEVVPGVVVDPWFAEDYPDGP